MADSIRAALVQTSWTGDKESMIKAHEEYARQAAAQGAKVICFQELFYGPYFCQVQDTAVLLVRRVDPRPDHRALPGARRRARHGHDPADVRAGAAGRPLQHRGRGRRRRQLPRQVPQDAHPAGEGLLGEVLLPARQPRLPDLRHRGRPDRRLHLLRPALPGGLAGARAWPARASCSTRRRPAAACRAYLWQLEQPAAAVANEYFIGAINRTGIEDLGDNDFYGTSYFVDPEGKFVGEVGDAHQPELIVRDLDLDLLAEVRDRWQFYRDRRPDAYEGLVQP